MEFFKVSVIIGILGVIFGLIPLWVWFVQKRENTNRIKKVNLKKIMIFYYVFMAILVVGFVGFIYLDKKYDITKSKPKTYNTPEPKIETHDEWFQSKNKQRESENYYDSYRIDYSEEAKENLKTIKAKELELLVDGVKVEGTPMIKRTYTFYGFNGFYTNGHHPEAFPTDLAPYVKNPFNKWDDSNRIFTPGNDDFSAFNTKHKNDDSQFNNMFIVDPSNHYTYLNYRGPKWLIEEDKDFFMDEVDCPCNKKEPDFISYKTKIYYLHLNPVKNYITLYTQKFNTKENKK